jgi:hypothetical protein
MSALLSYRGENMVISSRYAKTTLQAPIMSSGQTAPVTGSCSPGQDAVFFGSQHDSNCFTCPNRSREELPVSRPARPRQRSPQGCAGLCKAFNASKTPAGGNRS